MSQLFDHSNEMETRKFMTPTKEKVKYQKSGRRVYLDAEGNKVPGVTTVLSSVAKPQLIDWAHKLGLQGIDYKKVRDDAASVGTICHFMCECYLKGQEADLSDFPKDQVSLAENGFIKFLKFWEESGLKVEEIELQLVHPMFGFGGSLDCVCRDKKGNLVLLDLKTSKAIYPEYWSQVAAYSSLWAIQKDPEISRHLIVRIGKDEAMDLEVIEKNDLTAYLRLFMGALMVYESQKAIKALEK